MNIRMALTIIFSMCAISCAGAKAAKIVAPAKISETRPPFERVRFKTALDRVISKDKPKIAENARWLAENPDIVVVLEGHCDERGSDEYNMELGDRRARSVMAGLIANGVSENQFASIVSQGERAPFDRSHNERAWQKNRRVEFITR